jgi:hypothetical protein
MHEIAELRANDRDNLRKPLIVGHICYLLGDGDDR